MEVDECNDIVNSWAIREKLFTNNASEKCWYKQYLTKLQVEQVTCESCGYILVDK
jgi:hypothetical protein